MSPAEIALLRRLANEHVLQVRKGVASERLAGELRIGLVVGAQVEYGPADHLQARRVLQARGIPLVAPAAGATRAQTQVPGITEKTRSRRPHADSVAFKVAAGACLLDGQPLPGTPGGYLVLRSADVLRVTADRILLVENVETFRDLHAYDWVGYEGLNVLAILRGDQVFSAAHASRVLVDRPEPVWLFADFDPAGLAMGLALARRGRLARVVAPGVEWLVAKTLQMRRFDLFASQADQYGAVLDQSRHPHLQQLWSTMKLRQAGLPQEWMVDAEPGMGEIPPVARE